MRRLRRHLLAELRVEARGRGCPGSRRSTRERASAVPLREGAGAGARDAARAAAGSDDGGGARLVCNARRARRAPCRRPGCAAQPALSRRSRVCPGPPEGTVSFLFVDIDGSTPLVRQLGDAYPAVLDAFRLIVTESTRRHAGGCRRFRWRRRRLRVLRSAAAARADRRPARTRERLLAGERDRARAYRRPTGGIELTPNGYVGLEVHRAARIGAAANGGQVLISRATADLLGELDNDVELLELGSFALRASTGRAASPARCTGPRAGLPPPRARAANIVHLPTHLTELIGRSRVIADVVERLQQREVRLLTLTGPGGMGKTRLAVASAALVAAAYPDGVHFVALEDAATAEQVPGSSRRASACGPRARAPSSTRSRTTSPTAASCSFSTTSSTCATRGRSSRPCSPVAPARTSSSRAGLCACRVSTSSLCRHSPSRPRFSSSSSVRRRRARVGGRRPTTRRRCARSAAGRGPPARDRARCREAARARPGRCSGGSGGASTSSAAASPTCRIASTR